MKYIWLLLTLWLLLNARCDLDNSGQKWRPRLPANACAEQCGPVTADYVEYSHWQHPCCGAYRR